MVARRASGRQAVFRRAVRSALQGQADSDRSARGRFGVAAPKGSRADHCRSDARDARRPARIAPSWHGSGRHGAPPARSEEQRLNSSHLVISYAVFCLKKKKKSKARCVLLKAKNCERTRIKE